MSKALILALALAIIFIMACAPKPVLSPPPTPAIAAPVIPQVSAAIPKAEAEALAKLVQEAKKEGKVVNYSFYMLGDVGLSVAKAFKEKYGITLEVIVSTAMVTVERIRAEYRMGQHAADMVDGSLVGTNIIVNDGFSMGLMDLPVFRERDVWLVPPEVWDTAGRQLITHAGNIGPFIHTGLVRPEEEPRSWLDLLDPKWKGQIAIPDPRASTTMDIMNVVMVGRGVVEKDYFEKLAKQELKSFAAGGARASLEPLVRKEGKIALASTSGAMYFIQQGAPIKLLGLKEGLVSSPSGLTMLSKAPHPNATKLFINWLFSQEGATIYAKGLAEKSIRKGVPDFTPEAAKVSLDKIYVMTANESDRSSKNREAGVMSNVLASPK